MDEPPHHPQQHKAVSGPKATNITRSVIGQYHP